MSFLAIILLLLILVPVLELVLLVYLAQYIGLVPTIALLLLGMIAGFLVLRWQGVHTLWRMREDMEQGIAPTGALFDGACLAVAGVLLIIPGMLTNTLALLLLIPWTRTAIQWMLLAWVQSHVVATFVAAREHRAADGEVIESYVVERYNDDGSVDVEYEVREQPPHESPAHDPPPGGRSLRDLPRLSSEDPPRTP